MTTSDKTQEVRNAVHNLRTRDSLQARSERLKRILAQVHAFDCTAAGQDGLASLLPGERARGRPPTANTSAGPRRKPKT